jgi:hypothetical protein
MATSVTKETCRPNAIGERSGQVSRSSCEATAEGGLDLTASTAMAALRFGAECSVPRASYHLFLVSLDRRINNFARSQARHIKRHILQG